MCYEEQIVKISGILSHHGTVCPYDRWDIIQLIYSNSARFVYMLLHHSWQIKADSDMNGKTQSNMR